MPSNIPIRRLHDIVENIEAISRYMQGVSEAEFETNTLVSDAVERCLERISEAVAKLGNEAAVLLPRSAVSQD